MGAWKKWSQIIGPKVHTEERTVVLLMPLYRRMESPLLLSLAPSLKAVF